MNKSKKLNIKKMNDSLKELFSKVVMDDYLPVYNVPCTIINTEI